MSIQDKLSTSQSGMMTNIMPERLILDLSLPSNFKQLIVSKAVLDLS